MRAEDMTLWERLTDERFLLALAYLGGAGVLIVGAALLIDRNLSSRNDSQRESNTMTTYRIVRFFEEHDSEVIETGLTLEEAQAHCNDPESSGSTCSSREGLALLAERGRWFDGYREEE